MTDAKASFDDEFVFIERYDAELAAGRKYEPIDEMGRSHGIFDLALFEMTTDHFRVRMEDMAAKFKTKDGKPDPKIKELTEDELKLKGFVEICVNGWSGIKNKAGKEIPFTKDRAFAYLNHPKGAFAMQKVIAFASDLKNYQPEGQDELPEGN
jgi:hypothetical protein